MEAALAQAAAAQEPTTAAATAAARTQSPSIGGERVVAQDEQGTDRGTHERGTRQPPLEGCVFDDWASAINPDAQEASKVRFMCVCCVLVCVVFWCVLVVCVGVYTHTPVYDMYTIVV